MSTLQLISNFAPNKVQNCDSSIAKKKKKKNQKYNIVCTYTAYFLGTPLQLLINADIHPSIHPFSSAYLIQSHSSNFMHEVQTRFRLGKQNDLVKEGHV